MDKEPATNNLKTTLSGTQLQPSTQLTVIVTGYHKMGPDRNHEFSTPTPPKKKRSDPS